jgi:hypothetical protein
MNYYSSASGSGSGSTPHTNESTSQPKKLREEFSHSNLIADPAQRKPIDSYDPAIRDQLKRAYALSGPTQPHEFKFPSKWMVDQWRMFQKSRSPRMLLFAYIAIFSLIRESLKILGVLSLHIKVI